MKKDGTDVSRSKGSAPPTIIVIITPYTVRSNEKNDVVLQCIVTCCTLLVSLPLALEISSKNNVLRE